MVGLRLLCLLPSLSLFLLLLEVSTCAGIKCKSSENGSCTGASCTFHAMRSGDSIAITYRGCSDEELKAQREPVKCLPVIASVPDGFAPKLALIVACKCQISDCNDRPYNLQHAKDVAATVSRDALKKAPYTIPIGVVGASILVLLLLLVGCALLLNGSRVVYNELTYSVPALKKQMNQVIEKMLADLHVQIMRNRLTIKAIRLEIPKAIEKLKAEELLRNPPKATEAHRPFSPRSAYSPPRPSIPRPGDDESKSPAPAAKTEPTPLAKSKSLKKDKTSSEKAKKSGKGSRVEEKMPLLKSNKEDIDEAKTQKTQTQKTQMTSRVQTQRTQKSKTASGTTKSK